jgi:cytoskeletal protein CcmA (bactofilin family)
MTKSKNLSIIDSDIVVDGTITSKGKLVIKGTVKGEIDGETVIIAEEGAVYSRARVAGMTIGGFFEGEIEATKELIILSTGTCAGTVVCKDLIVESGGILNAEVTCTVNKGKNGGNDHKKKNKDDNAPVKL